ncbi:MAG: histidine phosphatase family protein [Parcubacteria group bacterium]|nr:histidine phosphatase family protein [Parcubacteria group bacterium]
MRCILTRHTTTDWNTAGRIQGHTDVPLGLRGKVEAEELAKTLVGFDIQLIVSSDLKRARETAEIINVRITVPLEIDPRLRECAFGTIEGLTRQQAIDLHGPLTALNWEDNHYAYDFRPFGGEDRDSVFARHMEVLKSLSTRKQVSTILLVGHGRGFLTLLAGLGQPPHLERGEYRAIEYNP